ncbi:putative fatty acyl-CoA reductase CG5065 [Schistocerca serialis cubense]|uniref:putative fatty acyl-CoA reductase CG5065 n=1 Tax=Schistocerca serialis cubense TaxID=2023355 RepID=UPI00214EF00E|nr:putative fatty acyl-CoA reductase CG5065 [Schistocerca serialis cubense]
MTVDGLEESGTSGSERTMSREEPSAADGAVESLDVESLPDRISSMLDGREVLVTGGTGFLGKVFVEKLLRVCPGIARIYLLVRAKKGKDPRQRVDDIFSSPLFDKLKAERGADLIARKVVGVAGDVAAPDLGLSATDRRTLCERVSIIYHAAATIRFDEELKKAVMLNTRGTRLMLELAKEVKKLDAFVYISTAYCHLEEKVLHEKAYPPPADPHKTIKFCENMSDDICNSMTKSVLGNLPNTYAFTKALAEGLCVEAMEKGLPVLILRPSVVIPIWKEPLPGWTDNINGPTGLLIGAGKGVIRTMYCDQNGYADYLPVDIAVNGIMIATWNYVANGDKEKSIVNMTSSSEFQISWAEIIERGRKITERVPLNGVVWYPGGSMKRSRLLHNICLLFFHFIPAILIDTLIFLAGHKPIMMRVQRRIMKGFEVFEYYANNQWQFINDSALEVRKQLNKRERLLYKIDGDDLDIDAYFEDCIRAARLYILKELPETLPAARRHLRIMYWVDKITKAVFLGLLLWTLVSYSEAIFDFLRAFLRLLNYSVVQIFNVFNSSSSQSPSVTPVIQDKSLL